MKLILAVDPNGGIGNNLKLPWDKLEGDLQRFKELTTGQTVVMGRITWDSLPKKPLPNRTNIVVTKKPLGMPIDIATIDNVDDLVKYKDAWIIGGAKLIESCWNMINEIHLSRTYSTYTCDTFIDLSKIEKEFMCYFKENQKDHSYEIWRRR